ncbi:glycosyltransferase family 1 protein [Solirubrobacter sp. CPCC 204708]|uniref:Glycosyltransferase n=1 Tax=Solirubrobacter deserti TaxID=2282478 RepID=A0ABT4RUJ1_9ACTN|nr:glycosyltransferase [Solirubrobacter deserti]MBE2320963.1 glycosyltransferase family 1 protein [Solirubrobacter deserti]MDA0142257.1 glycosyltransferase [Solirubrobacter deserti]
MRILVTTTGSAGHFGPLRPFLEAIRDAGGEVLVATRTSSAEAVAAAGYATWPLAEPPAAERSAIFASTRGLAPVQANERALTEVFAGLDVHAALPGMFDAISAWSPDVVLSEAGEFAGRLAGAHVGLPFVKVSISQYAVEEELLEQTDAALARARDAHGLRSPDREALAHFTLMPQVLEQPARPGPPELRRFRERDARTGGRGLAHPDPLVYLTFGTVAPQREFFPDLYRAAIDALAALPVRLLVTVGRDRDPQQLGSVSANVRVERWVEQANVLRDASAVVCHGGSGTVRGALAESVPLAVLPMFADQPHNAARVHELGAGIAVGGIDELAGAVRTLLADERYAARAAVVADEIRALPTVDAAAQQLIDP